MAQLTKRILDSRLMKRFRTLLEDSDPTEAIEIIEGSLLVRNILYDSKDSKDYEYLKSPQESFLKRILKYLSNKQNKQNEESMDEAIERSYYNFQEYYEKERKKTWDALHRIYEPRKAVELFKKIYKNSNNESFLNH